MNLQQFINNQFSKNMFPASFLNKLKIKNKLFSLEEFMMMQSHSVCYTMVTLIW